MNAAANSDIYQDDTDVLSDDGSRGKYLIGLKLAMWFLTLITTLKKEKQTLCFPKVIGCKPVYEEKS